MPAMFKLKQMQLFSSFRRGDHQALGIEPAIGADFAETEKWFGRNCDSVIGRACTPLEKGDFISYMIAQ